jgi:hypothetical protein
MSKIADSLAVENDDIVASAVAATPVRLGSEGAIALVAVFEADSQEQIPAGASWSLRNCRDDGILTLIRVWTAPAQQLAHRYEYFGEDGKSR